MKKKVIIGVIALVLLAGLSVGGVMFMTNGMLLPYTEVKFTIMPDDMTSDIADRLEKQGIISNRMAFELMTKMTGADAQFQTGSAEVNSKMSYSDIIEALQNTTQETVVVTIPEGLTLEQIAQRIEENGLVSKEDFFDEVANGQFDYEFLTSNTALPNDARRLEGYLFPETYHFYTGITAHDLIDTMLAQFDTEYTPQMREDVATTGLTDYEILILASIIEKEGKTDLEIISSVFHNRLNSDEFQKLQSCATVLYALGETKEVLSLEDIEIDSPYNTYINDGLTPTPICVPGIRAIRAAIYPMQTDYLYFIAQPDGTNSFSLTYEEHLEKQ